MMANNININPNILNENVDKVVLRPAQLMGKCLREVSENMKCLQYLYQMRMDKIGRANEDWAETVSCKNRYY